MAEYMRQQQEKKMTEYMRKQQEKNVRENVKKMIPLQNGGEKDIVT